MDTSTADHIPEPDGMHQKFIALLSSAGVHPTKQRLAIAQVLLDQPTHCTADEVLAAARAFMPSLSRATVYNTLPLFVEKGLLRALHLDAERTVYDSRPEAHSHLYHEDTGLLEDLLPEMLPLMPTPRIPDAFELLGLDVIVRVRKRNTSECPASLNKKYAA